MTKIDYVSRASYVGTTLTDGKPYYCLCRVVKNGPGFEEVPIPKTDRVRKKYTPAFHTIEVRLSDGARCWTGFVDYEQHNVGRKKAGGRDDTWDADYFIYKVADAFQWIADRPNITIKIFQSEGSDSVLVEIKENINGIIWNFVRKFTLDQANHSDTPALLHEFHELYFSSFVDICRTGNIIKAKSRYFADIAVDGFDANGWTLLQYACYCGHGDIAEWLIDELNASLDFCKDPEWRPILCAARNNHLNIVDFLLSRGVTVDNGMTTDSTVVSILLGGRKKSSLEKVCGAQGAVSLEARAKHGHRSISPVVGMFQLP